MVQNPEMRRLWLVSVGAILAILVASTVIARNIPGHTPSPIWLRLVAAVIVTAAAALAKVLAGPYAAAITGVLGALVAVVLLIVFA